MDNLIVNFDTFKDYEMPVLRLCHANDDVICVINNPTNLHAEFNFLDISTLSFRVDYLTNEHSYDKFEVKREIYLGKAQEEVNNEHHISNNSYSGKIHKDCGYFIITSVKETENESERFKEITAKSCEYELTNIAVPYIGKDDGNYGNHALYFQPDMHEQPDSSAFNIRSKSIMKIVMDKLPGWSIEDDDVDYEFKPARTVGGSQQVQPEDIALLPTRTFETHDNDTIYGFLMNKVAEAYKCVFVFDIYNRRIHIMSQKRATTPTDIVLSKDNLLNNISITRSEDDRVNCIQVTGGDDLSISPVNPLGGNEIFRFTEEYDKRVMSTTLWEIMEQWVADVEANIPAYISNTKRQYEELATQSALSVQKNDLETQKNIEVKERDVIVTKPYSYGSTDEYNAEISSHTQNINTLNGQIESVNSSINSSLARSKSYESANSQIKNSLDFMTYIHKKGVQRGLSDETIKGLYIELIRLIKTYEYKNDSIVIPQTVKDMQNDSDRIDKEIEIIQSLYDDGKNILERTSNPREEVTIDSSDFLFAIDYAPISSQLETGCTIKVENPDCRIEDRYVLKLDVDYSEKSFKITLSNRYRLSDALSIFEDSYGNTSSIASLTSSNYIELEKQKKQIDLLDQARQQSLNMTKQAVLSTADQDVIVDETGILVRTKNAGENDTFTYDPCELKIVNSTILFTEDAWNTAGLAMGRFWDEREHKWHMGINGEHIMANTIEASSLTVGAQSSGSGTNLLKDGSFDIEPGTTESPWAQIGSGIAEGTVSYVPIYMNDDDRFYEDVKYVRARFARVRSGVTATKTITFDSLSNMPPNVSIGLYCFTRGRILINGTEFISSNKVNNTGEHIFERHKIGSISNARTSVTINISFPSITYQSEPGLYDTVGDFFGFHIVQENSPFTDIKEYKSLKAINNQTDDENDDDGLEFDDHVIKYDLNFDSTFSFLSECSWMLGTSSQSNPSKAKAVGSFTHSSGKRGLKLDSNYTYLLMSRYKVNLTPQNLTPRLYIETQGESGSVILINTYLISQGTYNLLINRLRSTNGYDLNSLEYDLSATDLRFSTYINCSGNIDKTSQEIQNLSSYNSSGVYLLSVISCTSNSVINRLSLVDEQGTGTPTSIPRFINAINPLLELNNEYRSYIYNVAGTSYTFLKYGNSGGFDSRKYITISGGYGLKVRNRILVFPELMYCLSAYVRGEGYIVIAFYNSLSSDEEVAIEIIEFSAADYGFSNSGNWKRVSKTIEAPLGARYAEVYLFAGSTNESDIIQNSCDFDGVLLEQSSSLNAYKANYSEAFAKYTTITDDGIKVFNGNIAIYDGSGNKAFYADTYGSLYLKGKVSASSGDIGSWEINSNGLYNNDGTAEINAFTGHFISKSSGKSITTDLGQGIISFYGSSPGYYSGSISSSISDGTLTIEGKSGILFDVNDRLVADLGEKINFVRPILDCVFDNNITVNKHVFADNVFIGTKKDAVALAKDLEQLRDDFNVAIETINGNISSLDRALSDIPNQIKAALEGIAGANADAVTVNTSVSDADTSSSPGTETSTTEQKPTERTESDLDWKTLYYRMCSATGYDGGRADDQAQHLLTASYRSYCETIARRYPSEFAYVYKGYGSTDWIRTYDQWYAAC